MCTCCCSHINGPRSSNIRHHLGEEEPQTIEISQISDQSGQVVTTHSGSINIIGQDDGGNPIDIHLVSIYILLVIELLMSVLLSNNLHS